MKITSTPQGRKSVNRLERQVRTSFELQPVRTSHRYSVLRTLVNLIHSNALHVTIRACSLAVEKKGEVRSPLEPVYFALCSAPEKVGVTWRMYSEESQLP